MAKAAKTAKAAAKPGSKKKRQAQPSGSGSASSAGAKKRVKKARGSKSSASGRNSKGSKKDVENEDSFVDADLAKYVPAKPMVTVRRRRHGEPRGTGKIVKKVELGRSSFGREATDYSDAYGAYGDAYYGGGGGGYGGGGRGASERGAAGGMRGSRTYAGTGPRGYVAAASAAPEAYRRRRSRGAPIAGVEELLDKNPLPRYKGENADVIELKRRRMHDMDVRNRKLQKQRISLAIERWLLYPSDSAAFDFLEDLFGFHGVGHLPKARVIAKMREFFHTSADFEYLRTADLIKAYRAVDTESIGHLAMRDGEHVLFFKECLRVLLAKLAVPIDADSANASSSYDVVPYSDDDAPNSDSDGYFAKHAARAPAKGKAQRKRAASETSAAEDDSLFGVADEDEAEDDEASDADTDNDDTDEEEGEADDEEAESDSGALFAGPASAKKAAAKTTKAVAKKPVAKKPVAKKPVAKKPVAKKPVAKKPVAKKPVAKKPAAAKKAPVAGESDFESDADEAVFESDDVFVEDSGDLFAETEA